MTNYDSFWMPFTNNRRFKSDPRIITGASGMYYSAKDGRAILDATAGLWCVNAGHNRASITKAIQEQAERLDFAPTFQVGHPGPFQLANELGRLMPPGMDRVFFTNSGSEAADTSLKVALAYHRARGHASKIRFIGRERGYHGVNFGGMSVGGIGGNRRSFGTQVYGVDHLRSTHRSDYAFVKGLPQSNEDLGAELERLIALHGPDQIAAVIVEPVAGSTGVLLPPADYLQRLRQITADNDILLIFDEVITAFGRLGAATAAHYFDVVPDIINTAKGLTNGAVPMGAVIANRDIYDTVVNSAPNGIEFFHGYTYSGHPLAAAAGIATLKLYEEEGLFLRAARLAPLWEDVLHGLRGTKYICDIRTIGLVAGIELESRPDDAGARALEIFYKCFDEGLLIRVTGDIIALSPPLIIEETQIEEIADRLKRVIASVA